MKKRPEIQDTTKKEYNQTYYKKHCDRLKKAAKDYRLKNAEKVKQWHENYKKQKSLNNKAYHIKHRERILTNKRRLQKINGRERHLKSRYKMSIEQYYQMYNRQKGLCLICGKLCLQLHVDHCHTSNKIRGLLCFNCNIGLGNFSDDLNKVWKAYEYLEKNG